MKSKISERLFKIIKGEDVMDNETKAQLELEHMETRVRKSLLSPKHRANFAKKMSDSTFGSNSNNNGGGGSGGGEGGADKDTEMLEAGLTEQLVLLAHEDGLGSVDFNQFGSPMGS